MTAPANDNFADAIALTGALPITRTGDTNVDATTQASEKTTDFVAPYGLYDISKTVWYSWTCGTAGLYAIDTTGSDFDTAVSVFTGGALSSLTLVANNDEAGDDREDNTSRAVFTGAAGTTYRIQVASWESEAAGSIELTLEVQPPYFPASRTTLTLTGGSTSFSTTNSSAGTDFNEPLTYAAYGYSGTVTKTVWYEWEATADGVATLDTFDSDFDTTAAVYSGGSVSGLTLVNFNDDYEGGTVTIDQSELGWDATDGETYYVQIASAGTGSGSISGHLYFDEYASGGSADPAWDSGTASAYRIELRELNSSGFDVTTSSLELVSFSCNWRLNGPGAFEGAGVVGMTQADAANVGARELIVYKGSTAIWGGTLSFFDVDEDTKRVRVAAEGWWSRARARLMRGNQIYKPLTNSGVAWKADQIAWDIIDQAQGATYGDMGWVYGGHSGTRKNCKRIYYGVDRTNVGEAIEALAREGYFDFSVDVRGTPVEDNVAQFRTWAARGSDLSGSVNLSSSNAMTLNYSLASSDMATVIDVFGSVEGCRGVAATEDENMATYGRLEARPIDMETDEQDEVDETAATFIAQHSVPAKNAVATYLEGVGPDLTDYDLGDTIRVSPADGYVSYFDGRVVGRELAVEANRAVITVEVEK